MRNLNNTSSLMAATADTGGTNGDGGATANNSHAASDEQVQCGRVGPTIDGKCPTGWGWWSGTWAGLT